MFNKMLVIRCFLNFTFSRITIFVTSIKIMNKTRMGLVTAKEVAKAINADKYGVLGTFSGWLLMKVLKISTLNKVYDRNKHLQDVDFLNGILDDLQIKFEIPEEDLKRLPKEGAYITISNHPLGGIDGILLLKLMLEREPHLMIIAIFLLKIKQIQRIIKFNLIRVADMVLQQSVRQILRLFHQTLRFLGHFINMEFHQLGVIAQEVE